DQHGFGRHVGNVEEALDPVQPARECRVAGTDVYRESLSGRQIASQQEAGAIDARRDEVDARNPPELSGKGKPRRKLSSPARTPYEAREGRRQGPVNRAGRFSRKAVMPSFMSEGAAQ